MKHGNGAKILYIQDNVKPNPWFQAGSNVIAISQLLCMCTGRGVISYLVKRRYDMVGRVPGWNWTHENLPYHTDVEPNNKFIIHLSHLCAYVTQTSHSHQPKMTLYRVNDCTVYAITDMIWFHPGWAAPLIFMSSYDECLSACFLMCEQD